jgi:signal transduction histidine kinase
MTATPDIADHQARILIVDDKLPNRRVLEGMLGPAGFLLQSAASGSEALAIVAQQAPDLIMLDVLMPGMDGYQVVAAIKGNPDTKNIPIIIITALDDRNARMLGLSAGAEDFLAKPVDRAELCVRVRNLLRLKAYGNYYDKYSQTLEGEVSARTAELVESERLLRASTEQMRHLAAHLLSVREQERARISREVHDELGQSLTAVKMDLAWLEARMPDNGEMLERIRATRHLADCIIQSVRRISTELRPAVLDLGLAAAVEWQVQEFQARSGIQCQVRLLTREVVAANASTAMFRIFQETLTNVARHAHATRAEVVLQKQRDWLVLLVRDNGQGFDQTDPLLSKSLGLLGMRERAAILGGRVNISSAPGQGTTVTAWIPIPSPEQSDTGPAAIP